MSCHQRRLRSEFDHSCPSSAGGNPGENIGKRWHRNSLCYFLDRKPPRTANLQLRHNRWLVIPGDNSVDRMVGKKAVGEPLVGTVRKIKKGQGRSQPPTRIRTGQLRCSENRRGRGQSRREPWPLEQSSVPMKCLFSLSSHVCRKRNDIRHGHNEAAYQGNQ